MNPSQISCPDRSLGSLYPKSRHKMKFFKRDGWGQLSDTFLTYQFHYILQVGLAVAIVLLVNSEATMKRIFLLLSMLFCLVGAAHAQEDRARAEAALKTGVKQYKEGKYDAALVSYQEAAKFAPNAAGPYREMGKAYENLGKTQEALSSYEEYLRRRPQATDAAEIQARVELLQAKLPKVAPAKIEPIVEVKPQIKAEPATQEAPATQATETPLALATPIKPERNFKVRPSRVLSLGLAAATVVGTSVFLFGGFEGVGEDAAAQNAGDVGEVEGVARSLRVTPTQSKAAQALNTNALSATIKF
jgi:tetratricopeptide (TPR) repeat protein